jgi:hypothetical protein
MEPRNLNIPIEQENEQMRTLAYGYREKLDAANAMLKAHERRLDSLRLRYERLKEAYLAELERQDA